MYWWRVTKYNPKYRTKAEGYMPDHWVSFSEIGDVFDDGLLTLEKYLAVEDAYIQAIFLFMDCLKIDTLTIFRLRHSPRYKDMKCLTGKMQALFEKKNREKLTKEELPLYIRLLLRGYFDARLKHSTTMEVHFGYSYYMYIGSVKPCYKIHKTIKESGLFVESYVSPWLYC